MHTPTHTLSLTGILNLQSIICTCVMKWPFLDHSHNNTDGSFVYMCFWLIPQYQWMTFACMYLFKSWLRQNLLIRFIVDKILASFLTVIYNTTCCVLICFHSMPKMCCGFCHFASHYNYNYTYMILCAMDERSILYIYMQYCNRWFCEKRNMKRISLLARCVVDLMLVCHLNDWHVFHSLSFRCAFLCFYCFGLNTSYWHWNTVEYWLNKRLTCKVDWNWLAEKKP